MTTVSSFSLQDLNAQPTVNILIFLNSPPIINTTLSLQVSADMLGDQRMEL